MRQRFATVLVVAAAVLCSVPATSASARGAGVPAASDGRAGMRGAAGPVSGPGAFSPAWITSVSCASADNCSAGGFFYDSSGNQVALIVDDRHGTWGIPQAMVRGQGPASGGGLARIESVSCASPGNCGASGFFTSPHASHDFVVDEKHGIWEAAEPVPGLARLNRGMGGGVDFGPVSCASAGNCSAAGSYDRQSSLEPGLYERVFVITETDGTWGQAQQVPGLARLDNNSYAQIASVSCASAGNCAAGGAYGDPREIGPAFAVTESNGIWGKAQRIPGPAPGLDAISSVSCPSAGNCAAGGANLGRNGIQAFVVSQQHGTWGTAIPVPGLIRLNTAGNAQIRSVSCPSPGHCAAGGIYARADGSGQAFVATENNGTWGRARQVLGLATPGDAEIDSLSCASAGNCSAGGQYYISATSATEVFVVSEKHGSWGTAMPVPGLIRLNTAGDAEMSSLSCGAAGNCSAGGYYSAGSDGTPHAFVVSEKHGTWGSAHTFPAQRP